MTEQGVRVEWPTSATETLYAEVHRVVAAVSGLGGAVGWLSVPDRVECDEWLDRVLARAAAGRGGFAVVRLDGVIEAAGIWDPHDAVVLQHCADVRKVMVHPGARGRGLARVLVTALTEAARSAGVELLKLEVRGNNHGAMAVYEAQGWQRVGVLPNAIAVGDERFDQVIYALELQRASGLVLHGSRAEGPGSSLRRGERM